MSRSTLLILIVVIVLIIAVLVGIVFLLTNRDNSKSKKEIQKEDNKPKEESKTIEYKESGEIKTYSNQFFCVEYPKEWDASSDNLAFVRLASTRPTKSELDIAESVDINFYSHQSQPLDEIVKIIQNKSKGKVLKQDKTTIHNTEAVEYDWVNTEEISKELSSNLKFKTVILTKNNVIYQLTFTSTKEIFESYSPTFEKIKNSLIIK